jgi:hypothetical protein
LRPPSKARPCSIYPDRKSAKVAKKIPKFCVCNIRKVLFGKKIAKRKSRKWNNIKS